MSDTIVLRKIYALDSNTGLFISANKTLFTDGKGGALWTDIYSTLNATGEVGYLPSTLNSLSTVQYQQAQTIGEIQTAISTTMPSVSSSNLTSSLIGLGTMGYISSLSSESTVRGLGTSGYVSTQTLTSSLTGLGTLGYVSTPILYSSFTGLGSLGYLSTANLTSTVAGLGTSLYISTANLTSTVAGLGTASYVSTSWLQSSLTGLGSLAYISSTQLSSTIKSLGTTGYISTSQLTSTVKGIQSSMMNVRFDNVGNVNVTNATVTFQNVSTVLYTSTIYRSTFSFTSSNGPRTAYIQNTNDIYFSTATMDFTPFQSYIKQSTLVSLDVYPTYVFSKIGSGMGGVSVLPISTMLQVGQTLLETVVTTNFLVANQCKIVIDSETFIDGSNVYQTPIRLHIPKSTITTFASTYTLVHKMPSALLSNVQQNGLNDANIGVYFDTSRGIEISIQNIPGQ